jgi:pimeloyl-ACP methyl ester carboxylesterase
MAWHRFAARVTLAVAVATSLSPLATAAVRAAPLLAPHACGNSAPRGAQCATMTVPLDWSDAVAGSITFEVVRLPATDPAHRIGPLFVNPGGPGASGTLFLSNLATIFAPLNRRFDIVGFDPRGVSDPQPVRCETTAQLDAYVAADPIADDSAEKAMLTSVAQQLADGCTRRSGRLLAHVSTRDVARDMDALRSALGESAISYLGFSYGTLLGLDYAQQFPTRVRAMALDGNVDPGLSQLDAAAAQADSFEVSLQYLVSWCDGETECPLYPDAASAIDNVLSTLDASPATVDGRPYGRGQALVALAGMMYVPPAWPYFLRFWAAAGRGDYSGLSWLTDAYTGRSRTGYDPSLEAGTAVLCSDSASADSAAFDAAAAAAQARDPHFGAAAVDSYLPCASWPVHGSAPARLDLRGLPPVLLVGGQGDPATPYAWSVSLQQQVEGSVLLTRQGHGHPSYFLNSCVRGDVDAYFDALTTPPEGTVCPPG